MKFADSDLQESENEKGSFDCRFFFEDWDKHLEKYNYLSMNQKD